MKELNEVLVDLVEVMWNLRQYTSDYEIELIVNELDVLHHRLAKFIDPSVDYDIPENWISE